MLATEAYDYGMKRLIPASVAAFALIAVWLFTAPPATAQMNGAPASNPSIGSGGHVDHTPGTTSAGYNSQTHQLPGAALPPVAPGKLPQVPGSIVPSFGPRLPNGPTHPFTGVGMPPSPPDHHHHHDGGSYPALGYYPAYIVDPGLFYSPPDAGQPGINDSGASGENQDNSDEPAVAGPTIFDRRAAGESSQAVEAAYARQRALEETRQPSSQSPSPAPQSQSAPLQDQPQTILVFKDGRQLEVQNYAIIGNMLYDMTPGRRSRIALSDLDLAASARENDARGVDFQLPAGVGAN